ncbi:MAG: NAD-dependent epimerase/dehydratase family protein, partial [Halobacteriovoraceae bacterium]|nr:NAD-dependent epimerase/dehydratase family protein [Halobacteriovoraceae bacterium]
MARHLITGGNGFVGGNIARELASQGEEVLIVDIENDHTIPNNINFLNVDITRYDDLLDAMKGIDFVHHNAALVPLRKAGHRFREVNVKGTKNVLNAAKSSKVKHLSHMSSSAVFGNVTKK